MAELNTKIAAVTARARLAEANRAPHLRCFHPRIGKAAHQHQSMSHAMTEVSVASCSLFSAPTPNPPRLAAAFSLISTLRISSTGPTLSLCSQRAAI